MAKIFEKNKTYLGDCLELMPQMESGIFDMILCDLPYGTTDCKWDTIIPFEPLWEQYKRLIKLNGVIALTASQPFTSALVMSNPKMFKYEWIWHKNKVTDIFNANNAPLKAHENILIFGNNRKYTFNKQMEERSKNSHTKGYVKSKGKGIYANTNNSSKAVIKGSKSNPKSVQYIEHLHWSSSEKTGHPTQKPVSLFEYLIKTYTNEGDLILDNCAGSGTTGEACCNTGRNYIQIEKEQKYFDLILEREKSFNKKDLYDGTLFETQM